MNLWNWVDIFCEMILWYLFHKKSTSKVKLSRIANIDLLNTEWIEWINWIFSLDVDFLTWSHSHESSPHDNRSTIENAVNCKSMCCGFASDIMEDVQLWCERASIPNVPSQCEYFYFNYNKMHRVVVCQVHFISIF